VPRNAEVIRQWTILREIERARGSGVTIDELASLCEVTTRTIRRDLEALQFAGFPIYDEVYDGKKYWLLEQKAFKRLDATGFTLAELSALYFSRTLVECLAATPFQTDVGSAFGKLAEALTPGMRQFLDRLPLVIQAKAEPGAHQTMPRTKEIGQLLDATLQHRRVVMRYHSFSSDREKEYTIEPYRVVFAQGALYVVAFVPAYGQTRTFALDRIKSLSVTEDRFEAVEREEDAFAHSLGVHEGKPERIEIRFEPRIARYVRERVWHQSQDVSDQPDGGVILTMNVSNDFALRSWILGFGALARVLSPPELVAQIADESARTASVYSREGREIPHLRNDATKPTK
jgi:predicted DNA-binding transcriptional regulator YafY